MNEKSRMIRHLITIALAGIMAYAAMQWHEDNSIDRSHCHVTATSEGHHGASIGLDGRPRISISPDRELLVCDDGTRRWRDRL